MTGSSYALILLRTPDLAARLGACMMILRSGKATS